VVANQVKPQIIVGNRSKDSINALLLELSKAGLSNVIIQDGYYDDENSKTNIACAHKRCVIHAMDNDWPYAIILEDDVWFTHPDSWDYFIKSMNKLPQDWDIYTSGYYSVSKIEPEYQNIERVIGFCGLHCYAVSKKFYVEFLKCPPKNNIDWWSSQRGRSLCFTCYPFAAIQKPGYSENVSEYKDYSKLLIGKKIFIGYDKIY